MRKGNFLVMMTALACAAVVSSCSVNDDTDDNNGAVRFTAGIGEVATSQGKPVTKAAGTNWANGDAIGIFMVGHGTTNALEANKQYTTPGNGTFTAAAASDEIYYPMNGSAVDFIAYYPWKTGNTLGTAIDVEIGAQTAQPTFDLLWANADKGGTGFTKGDAVALTFEHKLAKLVMNTTKDASISGELAGMAVTIKGMNTKNTFDLSTGTLGTATTVADITPQTLTDGVLYDAIIMPAAATSVLGEFRVEFTLNPGTPQAETFTWQMPAGTDFAPGNEYEYTVTLKRTGVTATGSIKPWTPNTMPGVDAE